MAMLIHIHQEQLNYPIPPPCWITQYFHVHLIQYLKQQLHFNILKMGTEHIFHHLSVPFNDVFFLNIKEHLAHLSSGDVNVSEDIKILRYLEKLETLIGFALIYIMLGIFKNQAFKVLNYMKVLLPVRPSTLFQRYINNFCFFLISNFIGFEIFISLLKNSCSKYFTCFSKST